MTCPWSCRVSTNDLETQTEREREREREIDIVRGASRTLVLNNHACSEPSRRPRYPNVVHVGLRYVCVYIYIYVHTHTCMCLCVYMHMYVYIVYIRHNNHGWWIDTLKVGTRTLSGWAWPPAWARWRAHKCLEDLLGCCYGTSSKLLQYNVINQPDV